MTPDDALADAIALNGDQARLLYNPTAEIDSALEHLVVAARHCAGPARDHIRKAASLLTHVQIANGAERERIRQAAGQIEGLDGRRTRDPYALKALARTLGPALGDLANPIIGDARKPAALAIVRGVLDGCPPERIGTRDCPNVRLRHELGRGASGARKYELLLDVLDRSGATR